nr:hypothetical protein [Vibrio vulnificus]
MIRFFAKHPTAANLLMLTLLISSVNINKLAAVGCLAKKRIMSHSPRDFVTLHHQTRNLSGV